MSILGLPGGSGSHLGIPQGGFGPFYGSFGPIQEDLRAISGLSKRVRGPLRASPGGSGTHFSPIYGSLSPYMGFWGLSRRVRGPISGPFEESGVHFETIFAYLVGSSNDYVCSVHSTTRIFGSMKGP